MELDRRGVVVRLYHVDNPKHRPIAIPYTAGLLAQLRTLGQPHPRAIQELGKQ